MSAAEISDSMHSALTDACCADLLSPWRYGAATISALKKRAWVEAVKLDGKTLYKITPKGRRALAGIPEPSEADLFLAERCLSTHEAIVAGRTGLAPIRTSGPEGGEADTEVYLCPHCMTELTRRIAR